MQGIGSTTGKPVEFSGHAAIVPLRHELSAILGFDGRKPELHPSGHDDPVRLEEALPGIRELLLDLQHLFRTSATGHVELDRQ